MGVQALETTLSLALLRQYGLPLRGKRPYRAISVSRLCGIRIPSGPGIVRVTSRCRSAGTPNAALCRAARSDTPGYRVPSNTTDGHSKTPRLEWYEMTRSATPAVRAASMNTAIMTALSFPPDSWGASRSYEVRSGVMGGWLLGREDMSTPVRRAAEGELRADGAAGAQAGDGSGAGSIGKVTASHRRWPPGRPALAKRDICPSGASAATDFEGRVVECRAVGCTSGG